MPTFDHLVDAIARRQDNVIARAQVLEIGGSDNLIAIRLARGQWQPLYAGVYLVGSAPPSWTQLLRAAVYAAGPSARVSHRAAILRWGLDGIASAPIEIKVPFGGLPMPEGVIVHRTRRFEEPVLVGGIPTTGIEESLLEVGAVCPPVVVEKAAASAFRLGLTTATKVDAYLQVHGGKGRRGVTKLRSALELHADGRRPPGSDGEVAFLRELRLAGVPDPVRQLTIDLRTGAKATIDFAWPDLWKAVEFVGWWTHSDPRAHDDDTWREDAIREQGWDLRRFAPYSLRTRPEAVAAEVRRFLCRELPRHGANPDTKR
jgi:hypothetical protein